MGKKIGIDLGTTYSAVAIYNESTKQPEIIKNQSGNKITPSVIQICDDGEIIIGDEAKEAFDAGDTGCITAFKREMGKNEPSAYVNGQSYTSEDLSAMLLKELKENAQKALHDTIDEAVITVPAYFLHKERQATLNAAKKAGLKVRMLLNEPTAAALNYGMNHFRENAIILVYDLGGGTFDVTLLQMGKNNEINCLKTMGNHLLGGKDWDSALSGYLINKIESETGETIQDNYDFINELNGSVEKVKKDLTNATQTRVRLYVPNYGSYETIITRTDFEELTHSLLDQTVTLCESILHQSKLQWSDITDILLVGGSTRMPQVSSYLYKVSQHHPLKLVNPDEAVALGAAIQTTLPLPKYNSFNASSTQKSINTGQVKAEEKLMSASAMKVKDVQAHALGIVAVNAEGTYYENQNIIPANQEIPVKRAKKFQYYTSPNKNNEVDIYLLQGTRPILECEILNKYVISGIRHMDDPTTIRIQYSYDMSGMVHVQARQENDNVDLPIREEPIEEDLSRFGKPIPKPKIKKEDLTVLFVIDTSGSMENERIKEAKLSIKEFIEKLSHNNMTYGLIAFSSRVTRVCNFSNNAKNILNKLPTFDSGLGGYGTDVDPFPIAQKMFHNIKGKKYIIVLTDGEWYGAAKNAIQTSQKCRNAGIEIIAVGIGEADYTFLKQIATTDAIKIDVSQLRQSFGNIAQTIGGQGSKNDTSYSETETWKAVDE